MIAFNIASAEAHKHISSHLPTADNHLFGIDWERPPYTVCLIKYITGLILNVTLNIICKKQPSRASTIVTIFDNVEQRGRRGW